MKILQTVFDLMNYGGIVNYVEILAQAFRKLGHECEFVVLRGSTRNSYMIKPDTLISGAYDSQIGSRAHVDTGWYGVPVFSYGDAIRRKQWRKYARQFDLVIHQIPNPKWDPQGNWKKLYDIDPPQIIATHDAHYRDLYPYLLDVAEKVIAITAAQEAGYNAIRWFPSRLAFMGCPIFPLHATDQLRWDERRPRMVSAHVWKRWKRMDLVLRAIPSLQSQNFIAGDGIEARYMRSVEKCKPAYIDIWKRAMRHGMDYRGFISPHKLARAYRHSRIMVDMSWSKVHESLGNHFNYSTLEAINNGCIPLVTEESMREVNTHTMFTVGETHLEVPKDITSKELAREIDKAIALPRRIARDMNQNGRIMLRQHHSATKVAQWFLDVLANKRAGIYDDKARGRITREIQQMRDAYKPRWGRAKDG